MTNLHETLVNVREKISKYSGAKKINEQDTKTSLIQPVLRALGWDVEDLDEVRSEYKQKTPHQPVDYALLLMKQPCLFLEAKALGVPLNDLKWTNQIMGYATLAGVEWVVLTDGNEWRIYNSHATVPIEEKLFRKVRLSDDLSEAEETLIVLAKNCMEGRQIDVMWRRHFVDRQIQTAMEALVRADPEPDMALVRLMKKRLASLSNADIKAGLQRMDVRITFPAVNVTPVTKQDPPVAKPTKSKKKAPVAPSPAGNVSLADIIDAGILKPPLKLIREYKGTQLEAELLPDGRVRFQGEEFSTCSGAAEAARGSVIGGKPNTNGWTFWRFDGGKGDWQVLDGARKKFATYQ